MPVRDFIDSLGTRWEVEEWLAQHGDSHCLRFTAPAEVREFCPAPDGWTKLDDGELERLCRRGTRREEHR